jgi:predicted nucleotidyltransferase
VREKVERNVSSRLIEYEDRRWDLLADLRSRAADVQRLVPGESLVYGSVARGDVHPGSDVDIVLLDPPSSYLIELSLEGAMHIVERRLIIASPNSVPKANVVLSNATKVSWALLPPKDREADFHRFGGALDSRLTEPRDRVPGVTKRLLLVEPVPEGHRETSVVGAEVEAARALDLPLEVVAERVRVLSRRDSIGRTGVFRSISVDEGTSFEQLLSTLSDSNPAVRRQVRYRGGR